MDESVFDIEGAVTYLTQALYHSNREGEEVTAEAKMEVRRNLARALLLSGDVTAAQKELQNILEATPHDFGIAFLLKDVMEKVSLY